MPISIKTYTTKPSQTRGLFIAIIVKAYAGFLPLVSIVSLFQIYFLDIAKQRICVQILYIFEKLIVVGIINYLNRKTTHHLEVKQLAHKHSPTVPADKEAACPEEMTVVNLEILVDKLVIIARPFESVLFFFYRLHGITSF